MDKVITISPIEEVLHRNFSWNMATSIFNDINNSIKISHKGPGNVRGNIT